jgi:predicted RNA binding protein with dsRBD fold (UPF0201 family)
VEVEKKRLLNLIDALDLKAESSILDTRELETKVEAELRLKEMLREEELKWALRAKVQKVVQGDDNTQFFHMIANGKYRKKKKIQLEQDDYFGTAEPKIIHHQLLQAAIWGS